MNRIIIGLIFDYVCKYSEIIRDEQTFCEIIKFY